MFKLNVARIRGARDRFERVYEPKEFAAEPDGYRVMAPVTLAFDIFKDKDRFRLAGSVTTTLELPCSRCLEPFTWPVEASFDLQYRPRTDADTHGKREREVDEGEFADAFYEDDTIDLGELMTEQFLLSLPMKPLCQEACKGLCPQCGTNLNRATCTCVNDWVDPRLAALEALKRQ
jgi:uncharacterized protein